MSASNGFSDPATGRGGGAPSARRAWFTLKRRRHLPGWVSWSMACLVRLLRRTCRLRVVDPCGYLASRQPWPVVFVLWHNRLLFLGDCFPRDIRRRTAVLVSASRDGEYATAFARRFCFRTVRGSSSRGGHRALRQLKRRIDGGSSVAITLDGPRGPRYVLQPGVLKVAQVAGVPVMCYHVRYGSAWRLRTWDGMVVPRPFSRLRIVFDEVLEVPRGIDEDGFATMRRGFEERMRRGVDDLDWKRDEEV